jgi:uridine kinase
VAINLIAQHIKQQLLQRGWVPPNLKTAPKLNQLPPTIHVLKCNKQIESIHTIIRDKEISRDDFVFYADRLSRLVIEHALQFLPSEDIPVETPTGAIYKGKRVYDKICALPIMRAGDSMVSALCSVVRNVKVGKILIQSDKNKTPKLFFFELPKDLDDHYILVLDPLLGTGSTVTMAIRLLLDHNIPQEKIIFINLISSPQGVDMVTYTFPKVNIVTTAIDTTLSELGYILPGIGNFGDRYFGTDEEELDQEANKI